MSPLIRTESASPAHNAVVAGSRCEVLWQVLAEAYSRLGFDALGEQALAAMVLARLVEPASKTAAVGIAGLKGCDINLPEAKMPGAEVVTSYHDLWQVEASFRMTKSDLRARSVFHRQRDAFDVHLTVVFAALASARHI